MENIAVYLLDIDEFDRDVVENASYEQLEDWFHEYDDEEIVQKFSSIKSFQWAFNEEMVDDVNHWIVFVKKS